MPSFLPAFAFQDLFTVVLDYKGCNPSSKNENSTFLKIIQQPKFFESIRNWQVFVNPTKESSRIGWKESTCMEELSLHQMSSPNHYYACLISETR